MYRIEFSPRSTRDLNRLPEKIGFACLEFIYGPLIGDPHRVGKPLTGPLARQHSARRGSYRVLYEINETNQTVTIMHIDHRSDVYR